MSVCHRQSLSIRSSRVWGWRPAVSVCQGLSMRLPCDPSQREMAEACASSPSVHHVYPCIPAASIMSGSIHRRAPAAAFTLAACCNRRRGGCCQRAYPRQGAILSVCLVHTARRACCDCVCPSFHTARARVVSASICLFTQHGRVLRRCLPVFSHSTGARCVCIHLLARPPGRLSMIRKQSDKGSLAVHPPADFT
jgi:hypothetical protein